MAIILGHAKDNAKWILGGGEVDKIKTRSNNVSGRGSKGSKYERGLIKKW